MNQLVPSTMGRVATVFAGTQAQNDLAAGVQAGYGIVGYRGKVWSLRHRGDETQVMRPDGDGPVNSLELVIVKAAPSIAKIFYEAGYTEGSNAAPDCFSNDGLTPDLSAPKKQSPTCATCPHNAWGSRVTPGGKQGKRCGDSRRLAVVPLGDMKNEVFGGPMLLRVPAASLQALASFGNKMQQLGYPYYAIGTRVAFDPAEPYPKFHFTAIRVLSEEEAKLVVELQTDPVVDQILAEKHEGTPVQAQVNTQEPAAVFEQPPTQMVQIPQATPAPQPTTNPAPQPTTNPAPQATPAPAPTVKQTTAFGGGDGTNGAAPAAPQTVSAAPVSVEPVQSEPEPDSGGEEDFNAALEAKLDKLLPN